MVSRKKFHHKSIPYWYQNMWNPRCRYPNGIKKDFTDSNTGWYLRAIVAVHVQQKRWRVKKKTRCWDCVGLTCREWPSQFDVACFVGEMASLGSLNSQILQCHVGQCHHGSFNIDWWQLYHITERRCRVSTAHHITRFGAVTIGSYFCAGGIVNKIGSKHCYGWGNSCTR